MGSRERPDIFWQDSPAEADDNAIFRLLRTPSKGSMVIRCLDDRWIGARTHYWAGSTKPCVRQACLACEEGCPSRWHGWFYAQELRTAEVFIFEFTAGACRLFERHLVHAKSLRGQHVKIFRVGERENGRVVVQFGSRDHDITQLPRPTKLLDSLLKIWGMRSAHTTSGNRISDHEVSDQDLPGQTNFLTNGRGT